jgi:hypothetical protein
MSARIIVILIGVALVVPFFFLPRGIGVTVLLVLGGIALFVSLAEAGRQLFNDLRWMIARRSQQPFKPALSGARTTPDRTGG